MARAGTTTDYPWGTAFDPFRANSNDSVSGTVAVGSYTANAAGLFDMIGNVQEWTQDCHHDDYVDAPADGSAWLSGDCIQRIYRGGSWATPTAILRVSHRLWLRKTAKYDFLGFRLVEDR